MATLYYANQRLDAISTVELDFRSVYDPTGIDKECTEVTLTVEGVWSEYGLGSGKPQRDQPTWGQKGDRLAVSIYNLKEVLSAPRQVLMYYLGNTIAMESPQRTSQDSRFECDVKGGPFPEVLSIHGNVGDKTATVRFRVKTYISDCQHYLLSNRWRLTDRVDENGFTSLTISGRAAFRKDFLSQMQLTADDWRSWIVYPCEPRMRRTGIEVTVSADGCEVDYTVYDRETNYGTGATSLISNVDCHVTAGNDYPIKNVQDYAGELVGGLGDALSLNVTGLAARLLRNSFATCFVSGVCRITGQPGADRHRLARIAQAMVQDRVKTGVGFVQEDRPSPVSTRLSVDWGSDSPPWVEFRGDYFVSLVKVLGTFKTTNEEGLLNWSPNMGALGANQDTPRTVLPGASNTRAENVGRLVSQALSSQQCAGAVLAAGPGEGQRTIKAKSTTSLLGTPV